MGQAVFYIQKVACPIFIKETGNVLLSHSLATTVPLTSVGLTAVFGMGTGVAPPV